MSWSEWPEPDSAGGVNYFDVAIRARTTAGEEIELGRGKAGSVRLCGGAVLWNTADPATLRRWTVEAGAEVVWEDPSDEGALVGTVSCLPDGGLLTIANAFDGSDALIATQPELAQPGKRVWAVSPYTSEDAVPR